MKYLQLREYKSFFFFLFLFELGANATPWYLQSSGYPSTEILIKLDEPVKGEPKWKQFWPYLQKVWNWIHMEWSLINKIPGHKVYETVGIFWTHFVLAVYFIPTPGVYKIAFWGKFIPIKNSSNLKKIPLWVYFRKKNSPL